MILDGASVMKSMASMCSPVSQICMNHGSHLVLKDAFAVADNQFEDNELIQQDDTESFEALVKGILFVNISNKLKFFTPV